MQFVAEIFPEGHKDLNYEQLRALVDVANRSGFSVLGQEAGQAGTVYRIKLHVPMTDPYYIACLVESPALVPRDS